MSDVVSRNDVAKRDLLETYIKYGFEDEDDLDFYIQQFLGYLVPKHSFCVGHVSPWKFLCDVFFEKVNFVLAFGSRTSGKTTIEAIINHLNALFRQVPVEMLITAAANVQTDRAYTYFKHFLENDSLLYQQLAEEPIQSRTKFKNGSLLQIVSGTVKALNGPHPSKVSIDEVELMDMITLEQGLSMAMSKRGVKSQTVMLCVTGDTCIDVPRNLETHPKGIPIRDLVGTQGWVYSFNHISEKVTLKPYTKVWKTGKKRVYELTYSWVVRKREGHTFIKEEFRDSLRLTGDHPVMLRDGTYKRVDSLQAGDSLMPLNRFTMKGYAYIEQNTGLTYAIIDERVKQVALELNYPNACGYESIALMLEWPFSRVYESLGRLGMRVSTPAATVSRRQRELEILRDKYECILQQEYVNKGRSLSDIDREFGFTKDTLWRAARRLGFSIRPKTSYFDPHALVAARQDRPKENHKVVSVTLAGYEDVYDMEVPETHNFAAQGIFLHNSTRKTSNGTVSTLLDEQQQRQLSVYNFCIWETLAQCTRACHNDPEFGDCIAFDKCKGKAHEARGWYPIADFVQKTANLSKSAFATEWENKTPSGGARVYGEYFDEEVHVISMVSGGKFKSFQSIFNEKEIPKNWRRIGGMDFGSHFGFGMIAIEPRYDIWVLFFEYYFEGDRLLGTHANIIKNHPYWRRQLPIFSDPSGKQSILEMRGYGLNCLPAMNDLAEGVDEVKKRLEVSPINGLPKLYVMDTCVETRREFNAWEHGSLPDGKPDLDTYEDGNDHMLDLTRYGIFTYPRLPKSHIKPFTMAGV